MIPNTLALPGPKVLNGPHFVCNVCCEDGALYCINGVVFWDCPHHMLLRFDSAADPKIVERRGTWQ